MRGSVKQKIWVKLPFFYFILFHFNFFVFTIWFIASQTNFIGVNELDKNKPSVLAPPPPSIVGGGGRVSITAPLGTDISVADSALMTRAWRSKVPERVKALCNGSMKEVHLFVFFAGVAAVNNNTGTSCVWVGVHELITSESPGVIPVSVPAHTRHTRPTSSRKFPPGQ